MKMHKILTLAIAVAIGGVAVTHTPPAAAQWAVFDPTNFIQNFLQQLRAVQSNINEAQQLQAQLQQYQNMLRNTRGLDVSDIPSAIDALTRLERVIGEGKALAVTASDYDQAFRTRFPGYQSSRNYSESYRDWSATSQDSVFGALRVANMQAKGAQNEAQALAALRSAVRSADGQKAAVDAGNQIALAQISQLQQLRELMMAQMQASGTYMASQQQAEAAREASVRDATKYRDPREGWKPKPVKIGN